MRWVGGRKVRWEGCEVGERDDSNRLNLASEGCVEGQTRWEGGMFGGREGGMVGGESIFGGREKGLVARKKIWWQEGSFGGRDDWMSQSDGERQV